MMSSISASSVVEVDDAGLAEILRERQWHAQPMRTGQFQMNRSPAIIFSTFRWLTPDGFSGLEKRHPGLGR